MDNPPARPPDRGEEGQALMPVLFIGHGSPMNAIDENPFSREWRQVGGLLPRPRAILCISAHWETWGTLVTAAPMPRTIHDFGGFPPELYAARYPAPGSPPLAEEVRQLLGPGAVGLDLEWGLDHGCWSVLLQMFPHADIPVAQLSLNAAMAPQDHYALAQALAPLRRQGVLILGSGNIVHNLRRVVLATGSLSDFNRPFGLDWALEARALFKALIDQDRHAELADYPALGPSVQLAVPTPEHYLPLLYALAVKRPDDSLAYFNDEAVGGSLSMTSLLLQSKT